MGVCVRVDAGLKVDVSVRVGVCLRVGVFKGRCGCEGGWVCV